MIFRSRERYFRDQGRRLHHREQWARHQPGELLSIPHLHSVRGVERYSAVSTHERLIEIHSAHTSYEYYMNPSPVKRQQKKHRSKDGPYVQDLLAQGMKVGFVAGADHPLVGTFGLTAVLADERSKDAIFEALLARRSYATTGARMIIDLQVGQLLLGEETTVKQGSDVERSRTIHAEVIGQDLIETVQLIRNNRVIFEERPAQLVWQGSFTDTDSLLSVAEHRPLTGERTVFYYLRVEQADEHIGWTSPVFFICDNGTG
jgi:hypothetical protein